MCLQHFFALTFSLALVLYLLSVVYVLLTKTENIDFPSPARSHKTLNMQAVSIVFCNMTRKRQKLLLKSSI